MNWDAVGAISEFLGAIAVLITLIYLALQIKQNRQSVESSTSQAILTNINDAIQNAASSAELSDLLIRGQSNIKQLSNEERNQFVFWFLSYFRIIEQAYHHYLDGHFKDSIWEGHARITQTTVKSPGVQQWWGLRKNAYSKEFQEFIDKLIAEETAILSGPDTVENLGQT